MSGGESTDVLLPDAELPASVSEGTERERRAHPDDNAGAEERRRDAYRVG